MKQFLSLKDAKIGMLLSLAGVVFFAFPTASADTLDSLDSPSVSVLTQKATEEAEKAAAEAAKVAKATNMISEVAVEYTVNTYPIGQCTWGAK